MVEVSLAAAVDKLDAATERERKEGLNGELFPRLDRTSCTEVHIELKHFLGHHRDVSQLYDCSLYWTQAEYAIDKSTGGL